MVNKKKACRMKKVNEQIWHKQVLPLAEILLSLHWSDPRLFFVFVRSMCCSQVVAEA